jgi:hypothetical protein
MDKPFIIMCTGDKAEEVKKLIKEKFPELDFKIYTEEEEVEPDEELIRKTVEEVLKRLGEKKTPDPIIPDPIKDDPWNRSPWPDIGRDVVLMYGCPTPSFHTIAQAEENLKRKGLSDVVVIDTTAVNGDNAPAFNPNEVMNFEIPDVSDLFVTDVVKAVKEKEKKNKREQEKNRLKYANKHYKK